MLIIISSYSVIVRVRVVLRRTVVGDNSSSQNYSHPDDHTIRTTDTPGLKPFTLISYILHRNDVIDVANDNQK